MTAGEPLFDFAATDGVQHTLWRVQRRRPRRARRGVRRIPALYIADGHHRAASAARARARHSQRRTRRVRSATTRTPHVSGRGVSRTIRCRSCRTTGSSRTSAGASPHEFLDAVRQRFDVEAGPGLAGAARRDRDVSRAAAGTPLRPREAPDTADPIGSLDVSVLQDSCSSRSRHRDVRTDKRIDFVGGASGTASSRRLVDIGNAAVAFSLYPGERRRPDGRFRRRRDHAAEVDVVRAEAPRRPADPFDLIQSSSR